MLDNWKYTANTKDNTQDNFFNQQTHEVRKSLESGHQTYFKNLPSLSSWSLKFLIVNAVIHLNIAQLYSCFQLYYCFDLHKFRCSEIPVIHCSSGDLNPVRWDFIVNYIQNFFRLYPLNECYRVPSTYLHASRTLYELNIFMKHIVPAYGIDLVNSILGRKFRYL